MLVDGIPVKEYAAFVGGKAPGRIIRKVATLERYGRAVSPSIGGILGPIWFLRRKMIKIGAVLSALVITFCLAAGLLQMTDAYKDMGRASVARTSQAAGGSMSVADMRDRLAEIQEDYIAAGRTPDERASTPRRNLCRTDARRHIGVRHRNVPLFIFAHDNSFTFTVAFYPKKRTERKNENYKSNNPRRRTRHTRFTRIKSSS